MSRITGGLSPRVRGNRADPALPAPAPGSIPACAGEPWNDKIKNAVSRVYPRVCGGTVYALPGHHPRHGLSPRVRGNLVMVRAAGSMIRSIPACAGEPIPDNRTILRSWVYPRVCGGTPTSRISQSGNSGLSPRVRGNPNSLDWSENVTRSIPACAGEPQGTAQLHFTYAVYPRVCGGTARAMESGPAATGLSPRVRGNRTKTMMST